MESISNIWNDAHDLNIPPSLVYMYILGLELLGEGLSHVVEVFRGRGTHAISNMYTRRTSYD